MTLERLATALAGVLFFLVPAIALAQEAPQAPPPRVPVSGTVLDENGSPRNGLATVVFSVYPEQSGGVPIWQEVQLVALDGQGRYAALLGAMSPEGVPLGLFTTGEARWLGIQVEGAAEQPRVMLASVPYAIKAADANTLGGFPASAFVRSEDARSGPGFLSGTSRQGAADPWAKTFTSTSTSVNGDNGLQTVAENLIVQGSLCVGSSCATDESFGFSTVKLKEDNLRIEFDDASTTAGYPANDWEITINDSTSGGASYFAIADRTAATVPFQVRAGARTNALFVDSSGRIGLGTSSPVLNLHAKTSNTPAMRFEQDTTGGWTAQTWDVAGNETNFFIRDVTNGSRLPFRIRPGAPSDSLHISAVGNVGLGVISATQRLDVRGNIALQVAGKIGSGVGYGCTTCASTGTIELYDPSTGDMKLQSGAPYNLLLNPAAGHVGIGVYALLGAGKLFGCPTCYQSGYLQLYDPSTGNMTLQSGPSYSVLLNPLGGRVGIGTSAPAHPLQMASGAHVTAGGVWTNASSRSLKRDITPLAGDRAARTVAALEPVTFVYDAEPGHTHVGFIAEDVPDLVASADRKTLATMDVLGVVAKVVQDQQRTLGEQRTLIEALTARVAELERRLRDARDETRSTGNTKTRRTSIQ